MVTSFIYYFTKIVDVTRVPELRFGSYSLLTASFQDPMGCTVTISEPYIYSTV
jgi:hypothetical protein